MVTLKSNFSLTIKSAIGQINAYHCLIRQNCLKRGCFIQKPSTIASLSQAEAAGLAWPH
jgi:hypothetical protein